MKTEAQNRVANYRGGWLDLSGCDLKGVTLPKSIGGWLDLSGCDLKGATLPESLGGSLDLSGCDLKGVTLPESIGGSLDIRGCDLKGVTLPKSIGGGLDLSGCDLKGATLPPVMFGKRGHMIAFDGEYVLWAADDGTFSAGCRQHLTRSQALKHWDNPARQDDRAILFTLAIGLTPSPKEAHTRD